MNTNTLWGIFFNHAQFPKTDWMMLTIDATSPKHALERFTSLGIYCSEVSIQQVVEIPHTQGMLVIPDGRVYIPPQPQPQPQP